jgi:hypothetical protein
MTPVELVLSKLPDAKRNGHGWQACCPAHDDQNPSLNISEGNDGRALVMCHAGCATEDVVASMELTMASLMPAPQMNGMAAPADPQGPRRIVKA